MEAIFRDPELEGSRQVSGCNPWLLTETHKNHTWALPKGLLNSVRLVAETPILGSLFQGLTTLLEKSFPKPRVLDPSST